MILTQGTGPKPLSGTCGIAVVTPNCRCLALDVVPTANFFRALALVLVRPYCILTSPDILDASSLQVKDNARKERRFHFQPRPG